jgi:NAD(P)-dependent dehydrogenase (short-subunit alcohol dehydrogenase family)
MIDLASQKILVIGGSSGMGLAAAKEVSARKAALTIAARSTDRLEAAAKQIGGAVATRVLDARDDAAVDAFFKDGTVWDHIVVTVGQGGRGPLASMSMTDALAAMDAKFWCCFRIGRAAKIARGGSLTFVSGGEGHRGQIGTTLISSINAAIAGLTRGLAIELAPVRVNTLSPGTTDTPLRDRMKPEDRAAMFKRVADTLPVKRLGQAEDAAHAILFLMTNPFTTGQVVRSDGGGDLL